MNECKSTLHDTISSERFAPEKSGAFCFKSHKILLLDKCINHVSDRGGGEMIVVGFVGIWKSCNWAWLGNAGIPTKVYAQLNYLRRHN
jgi:hypothetical protein